MRNYYQSISDWSRPRLPTTASGVALQDACENYATCGNYAYKKQREAWKGRRSLIRVGTLNIKNDNWKERELDGRYDGAKKCRHIVPKYFAYRLCLQIDILCLQETKWKGSKAKNIGGGCKYFTTELMEEKMG